MDPQTHPVVAARNAFQQTIQLKLKQFYEVVPKGSNPELTGDFVEELVRGFIREWISPCVLASGTLYPHSLNPDPPAEELKPPQIDGIVFDPRLGPPIIREGEFVVAHPAFCHGVIEIKTSVPSVKDFEDCLQSHRRRYFSDATSPNYSDRVMGVVVHDSDPQSHSWPKWMHGGPLFSGHPGACPIFILFKRVGDDFEAFPDAIDRLILTIFKSGWAHGAKRDSVGWKELEHDPHRPG